MKDTGEGFGGSSPNRVRVPAKCSCSEALRHPWVGSSQSFHIAKEPCLEFLNRDPISGLKPPPGGSALRRQTSCRGYLFEALLESLAVLLVAIDQDQKPELGPVHGRIRSKTLGEPPEQRWLPLVGMDRERGCRWQDSRQELVQSRLGRWLLYQHFQVQGHFRSPELR